MERSHRPLEGCGAVSVCLEDETPKKDDVIAALKKEVSALKLKLSQKKQTDPEVTHRLRCLESDIKEKKEQIEELKEQVGYELFFVFLARCAFDCHQSSVMFWPRSI